MTDNPNNTSRQPKRYVLLVDLAGRVSESSAGSDRVTVAAVAIEATQSAMLREIVRANFGKWRDSSLADATKMIKLMSDYAAGIAICSVVKAEPAWSEFWRAAQPLHEAIVKEERRAVGFVKPGNAARFVLFTRVLAGAMAIAVCESSPSAVKTDSGLALYDRCVVVDSDLEGDENVEVFKHLCFTADNAQDRVNQLGVHCVTQSVDVFTEEYEPLLLLADFAAGIGHSAHIPNPGRIPFPVGNDECKKLLSTLVSNGRTGVVDQPFDFRYDEMFGEAHRAAVEQANLKRK